MGRKSKEQKQAEAAAPVLFELPPLPEDPTPEEEGQHFNYKVTDAQFWACMVKAYGIVARCARLIKRDYDVDISRQAIDARAKRHPEKLANCRALIVDTAEEQMIDLLLNGDKKTRAEMVKLINKTLGKDRGYTEKVEQHNTGEMSITHVTFDTVSVESMFPSTEKDVPLK